MNVGQKFKVRFLIHQANVKTSVRQLACAADAREAATENQYAWARFGFLHGFESHGAADREWAVLSLGRKPANAKATV